MRNVEKVSIGLLLPLLAAVMCAPAMAKGGGHSAEAEPLPPGLQKKAARGGQLPPGWLAKLQKGRVLEPELYRLGRPISDALRVKLPAGPAGSVEIVIEGRIVRLARATHEILDVFDIH